MALIAVIYLLLAMPVRAKVFLCMHGFAGNVLLEVGLPGMRLCRNAPIPKKGMRRKRNGRSFLGRIIRACTIEGIGVEICIGTGDAAQTALAAGALRAGLTGVLSAVRIDGRTEVCVVPVFDKPCFSLAAQGILSAKLGDIMYAALRAALKKSGKEGFDWKSIPLRA